jgi:hypothetical protein
MKDHLYQDIDDMTTHMKSGENDHLGFQDTPETK